MYCTYDTTGSFYETKWHVFSTEDCVNWIDHGPALDLKDVPWATEKAWAPDAAFENGMYYFFHPASRGPGQGLSTGVAISSSPTGPFKVVGTEPLLDHWHDPAVFKDDDGQCYLYSQTNIVKLNPDLISLAEEPRELQLIGRELPERKEAVWVFKRKDIYYWIIAEKWNEFTYWMGDNPYGPFTYTGIIMPTLGQGNNHPGIIQFKGKWILFYHRPHQYDNIPRARRIHADYLVFNEDGTIQEVQPTKAGVSFKN